MQENASYLIFLSFVSIYVLGMMLSNSPKFISKNEMKELSSGKGIYTPQPEWLDL